MFSKMFLKIFMNMILRGFEPDEARISGFFKLQKIRTLKLYS